MNKKTSISFPGGASSTIYGVFDLNESCPHCGYPVEPIIRGCYADKIFSNRQNTAAIVLQCPRTGCRRFHVQAFDFTKVSKESSSIEKIGSLIPYSYKPLLKNDLPNEIREAFPEFDIVYNQALEAESIGLDQIAGLGFRKSLEFLIKSFAIKRDPDSENKIKLETLNNTIRNRYNDLPRIQNLLELSSWIGNDEAHFVKKHSSLDIQTMKRFIRSASMFISGELDYEFSDAYVTAEKEKIKQQRLAKQNQNQNQ